MTLLQYITFYCKQLPLRGQEVLSLQLQKNFDDFNFIFMLWEFIMLEILGMELQLTLKLFRLKILQNLCVLGKFLFTNNYFFFANINCHVATVWWIKPYNSRFSVAFSFLVFNKGIMLEFDNLFITTVPLSIVLRMFYTVENVFVRGQFIYFLCYTIGEVFGNIWWVVGVKIDI